MAELITYSFNVSVCMILLYWLYTIILRKETFFHFNRAYLLSSIIISLIIPLLNIPLYTGGTGTRFVNILQTVQVGKDNVFITKNEFHLASYITIIYLTGFIILLVRFITRFISIVLIRRQCMIEKKDGIYIAMCKKRIAPFSFFCTIFINKGTIDDEQQDKIIMHETIHIRQLHSLDIIFAETICLLTWFNPVSWMIKVALKETHEYLADSGVSEQTQGYAEYFLLLIKNAIGVQPGLANNLNKSLTLKRLKMMKKPRSGRLSMLKALPVLPVVVLLFIAFSCNNSADKLKSENSSVSEKNETTNVVIEKMPEFPGGQTAMTKFIMDNVKYPEVAKKNGIGGKILVTFTVTKTGKIDKISILQKINDLLDAEAVRVVSKMPDWVPGKNKGIPVDVEMTLPINFKLD